MHPFSLGELHGFSSEGEIPDPDLAWEVFTSGDLQNESIDPLIMFGGFPEPFIKQNKAFHTRWIRSRRELITHVDVRDLTRIEDVDRLAKGVKQYDFQ